MRSERSSMFTPVAADGSLDPRFVAVSANKHYAPARRLMSELWAGFVDIDGNFLEQWQTSAFDARTWEFFLYAYFAESGYELLRDYERPDFIVERDGERVAIEAVTSNPVSGSAASRIDPTRLPFSGIDSDAHQKMMDEMPIRFGSPLFSKMKKRYWELPQCQGIPLVLAVQAFHTPDAIYFSSTNLSQYLYGLRVFPAWTEDGQLVPDNETITLHRLDEKVIPSSFFLQPNAEHVSAVLFGNTGTVSKFNRMGFQQGYGSNAIALMLRQGTCYNYEPNATEPDGFGYDVATRSPMETWGEGLEVMLNPNAANPLPPGFFVDAAQSYLVDGVLYTDVPRPFHPYFSQTHVMTVAEE